MPFTHHYLLSDVPACFHRGINQPPDDDMANRLRRWEYPHAVLHVTYDVDDPAELPRTCPGTPFVGLDLSMTPTTMRLVWNPYDITPEAALMSARLKSSNGWAPNVLTKEGKHYLLATNGRISTILT